jgi:uridine kinase
MFFDAARDFNLDLSRSFIIGDSERDVEAGINAGCITVGLMTGYGTRKTAHLPDFFFSDLAEAVDFIIDEPYRQVYNQLVSLNHKAPSVILIGGNARSGKSTVAGYLKLKLEQEGKRVLKISLDDWILPEVQREGCRNVYDRFQLQKIESDLQQILAGISCTITTYANHAERKPQKTTLTYTGHDFVIIEGVVALSSEVVRGLSNWKVFVDIPPVIHRQRIEKYYRWKGKSGDEIKQLYLSRYKDEYQPIAKERRFADFIVNSSAV